MLDVTFYRDDRRRLSRIVASGHAEFGESGEDVVCAAVSAILQAARLGLEHHAGVELEANQGPGTFDLRLPERARDDQAVRAIVATAELSTEQIARQFPTNVRVRHEP